MDNKIIIQPKDRLSREAFAHARKRPPMSHMQIDDMLLNLVKETDEEHRPNLLELRGKISIRQNYRYKGD